MARTIGSAVLALALLNASAGLCFCHRGPVPAGEPQASAGCCHGPDSSGKTAVAAASDCCQIEAAESAAMPVAAAQLAPPASVTVTVHAELPAVGVLPSLAAVLPGSSPPLFILRI
ncbi:MAG TPA: hypothetical protein VLN08_13770 [Vicinamibacterales bacterium]|nr:hypothetical protein [Vicinamibacterales bacterium]